MVRRNMDKIRAALVDCERVISGLTRGLDMDVLDRGIGEVAGSAVSFIPRSPTLGVVLPSNSPGVHALWVPTIALRIALVLKPGSAEPWTPYRVIQAFVKAGVPETAFGFYPTDHAGSGEILRRCGRGIVFGDVASTRPWQSDPRVEVHGPGYSKAVLGPDASADWERHLDLMASSIVENGGRSCINASGVWVTANAREIAEALAARLAAVTPRATEDEEAQLAPFANPQVAERISAMIDCVRGAGSRGRPRLRGSGHRRGAAAPPTCCRRSCAALPDHPLANREFLFPFASVEVRPRRSRRGPTLAASVSPRTRRCSTAIRPAAVHRLNPSAADPAARPAARGQPVRDPTCGALSRAGRRGLAPAPVVTAGAGACTRLVPALTTRSRPVHGPRHFVWCCCRFTRPRAPTRRTSPTRASSSPASASTWSSTSRSSARRRRCSTSSGTRRP
jgi:hypothetical protein